MMLIGTCVKRAINPSKGAYQVCMMHNLHEQRGIFLCAFGVCASAGSMHSMATYFSWASKSAESFKEEAIGRTYPPGF
jgi:coenzyme F420-reducing hydrogenase gamma subunit